MNIRNRIHILADEDQQCRQSVADMLYRHRLRQQQKHDQRVLIVLAVVGVGVGIALILLAVTL